MTRMDANNTPPPRLARPHRLARLMLGLALTAAPAAVEARPASVGFYAEVGMGATGFLGTAGEYSAMGPALDLRLGRDLTSWLSVGIRLAASTHEATVPPPPEDEYYQLYSGGADVRLGYRLDRLGMFFEGGAGASAISSNILGKVGILDPDEQLSITLTAGAGLEYQLENRHYAVGLASQWLFLPSFESTHGVETRLYLRYTY